MTKANKEKEVDAEANANRIVANMALPPLRTFAIQRDRLDPYNVSPDETNIERLIVKCHMLDFVGKGALACVEYVIRPDGAPTVQFRMIFNQWHDVEELKEVAFSDVVQ